MEFLDQELENYKARLKQNNAEFDEVYSIFGQSIEKAKRTEHIQNQRIIAIQGMSDQASKRIAELKLSSDWYRLKEVKNCGPKRQERRLKQIESMIDLGEKEIDQRRKKTSKKL